MRSIQLFLDHRSYLAQFCNFDKDSEEPNYEINCVGGTACEYGSVPFAETLQKSCGTLVDAKGHPVVDGKSRLSPVAQDVLSMFLLRLISYLYCGRRL